MTKEDIVHMAQEAGLEDEVLVPWAYEINMFAVLVAAASASVEREACAKVLDEMVDQMIADMEPSTAINWVRNRAAAIRSRSSEHCARDEATSRGQT